MSESYDWGSFSVHMYYQAPLESVWQAWSTSGGLESFFIRQAVHLGVDGSVRGPGDATREGDSYRWTFCHPFELAGTFRAVEPQRRVAFSFGGMEVIVALRDVGDAIEVRLEQSGCHTEDPGRAWDHLNCRSCWVFFMTNLKSVLEHGTDLRESRRPERNDSVSIGWRAPAPRL